MDQAINILSAWREKLVRPEKGGLWLWGIGGIWAEEKDGLGHRAVQDNNVSQGLRAWTNKVGPNTLSINGKDSTTGYKGIKKLNGDWLKHFMDICLCRREGMKSHRGLKGKLRHKKNYQIYGNSRITSKAF